MKVLRNNRILMTLCVLFALAALNRPSLAYPPDPENAALLYYQTFLTTPQDTEPGDGQLADYAKGKIELNKAVEDFISGCRGAIRLATTASQLRDCNWGLQYSKGFDMLLSHLSQVRRLAYVMIADARIQASKGNHELAFERCIAVLKMSRHVGDETLISFLVGVAMESVADKCIGDLLGQKRADSTLLGSLKKELAALAKKAPSPENSLDIERQVVVGQLKMEKVGDLMRTMDPDKSEEDVLEEVRKLGGEEFLKKSRDYYSNYMKSIMSILRSRKPYTEIHQQLAELAKRLEKQQEKDPEVMFTSTLAPAISKVYGNMIRSRTQANALRAAVELYIVKVKTKKLPNKLPAGLPKDLFSGKDFEYKKIKAGFILRCRAKDIDKDKTQEYEFNVAK